MESQNCPNLKSCVGKKPTRSRFLPKKRVNSKNQRILKSACQSVTFSLWDCREFNIEFLSQIFFLASPHEYWFRKQNWAKMSMLNFSRWLCNWIILHRHLSPNHPTRQLSKNDIIGYLIYHAQHLIDWSHKGRPKKKWFFFTFSQQTETSPPSPFFDHLFFYDKDFLTWPRPPPPFRQKMVKNGQKWSKNGQKW